MTSGTVEPSTTPNNPLRLKRTLSDVGSHPSMGKPTVRNIKSKANPPAKVASKLVPLINTVYIFSGFLYANVMLTLLKEYSTDLLLPLST